MNKKIIIDPYTQEVALILRELNLSPAMMAFQYHRYKNARAAFEAGHGTVSDMTRQVTPGVAAMLDLEDRMRAGTMHAERDEPTWWEDAKSILLARAMLVHLVFVAAVTVFLSVMIAVTQ